jgi:hypothetical protein
VLSISLFLAWAWLMLTLVGAVILMGGEVLPGGRKLAVSMAVFHAVSASTLTGYSATTGLEDFLPWGRQVYTGLLIIGSAMALVLGALPAKRLMRLKVSDRAVVTVAIGMLATSLALGIFTRGGVLQSVGALANSGAHLGSVNGSSPWFHGVLLPLSLLGGLGAAVVTDIGLRLFGGARYVVSTYSRDAVAGAAGLVVVLTALLLLCRPVLNEDTEWLSTPTLAHCLAGAVSLPAWGVPTESLNRWPRALQLVATLAAGLGLALGGTGAGLGVTTGVAVLRGVWRGLLQKSGDASPLFFKAIAWTAVFALLCLATWMVLLATEPQISADTLLMLAVGACANVSVSPDVVTVVGPGALVMSLAMLLGRGFTLAVLWWMATPGPGDQERTKSIAE